MSINVYAYLWSTAKNFDILCVCVIYKMYNDFIRDIGRYITSFIYVKNNSYHAYHLF